MSLDELEGKIIVREINVYSSKSIDAFYYEEDDLEHSSVYYGLAYSINWVIFGEEDDEINEPEEFISDEEVERCFEYYLIKNSQPELIENI